MMGILLYTLIFWAANASLLFLLHYSIQHGQWLDKLLNWQHRVFEWDKQGKSFLVKAIGGGCELCFCHIYTQILFIPYCFFMVKYLGFEITAGGWIVNIILYYIWYMVYVSIGTVSALNLLKHMRK